MASKKTKVVKKMTKKATRKIPAKKKASVKKGVIKSAVKKVSKKAPARKKSVISKKTKTSTKKKRSNKKTLIIATSDQCFWINEGPAVRDLVELRDILSEINKEQFIHHVNSMKNDFASWVEEVLCDEKCANNIRRSKTVSAMVKNIEKALLEYYY